MPHAVFNLGSQNATLTAGRRNLLPGVEPGGSRAGQETKPALLIRDAFLQVNDMAGGAAGGNSVTVFLKLSQEQDMTPGLLLFIGKAMVASDGTRDVHQSVEQEFRAKGTVWAPRNVAVRLVVEGTITFDIDVHIDYERVDIPWMDWFMMWEFLDNVVDNDREY